MATKKICDACGAEINPKSLGTEMILRNDRYEQENYDLCVSCAFHLHKWLDGEEKMVDKWEGI